ncbi:sugar porter family MFS transporter [Mucilaginibacter boryungensis]|uniref:Sugar porter family MFS transporter n=1 Tax=Mucilaginibacter boryungensis TaxID=768480 RepID=A0ABR9XK24_9SPHI|nr:sugar porter family MFS transporter [Mucilaginibacter boryungensis]MBE9667571.1 sugar porter family MFS transporter [Mucilaginibacter boryungensis]
MKDKSISLSTITIVASLGGFLFGFDMAVISGVLPFVEKQFSLSPVQEGWFVSVALLGCIIGVAFSGELSDRLGRRKPLLLSAALFLLSAIGCAFLPSLSLVIVSRLLGGIGIGIASNVVPLYISEIAPAKIRGRLVTYYQFALTFGILVAYLTNAGLVNYAAGSSADSPFHNEIWRAMFGLGAIPAFFFLAGLFIVPESPRWLIQKGREAEGLDIISRIAGHEANEASADQTPHREGSYKELFAPGMRKALLIGILLPLFSQFSGINAIIYYGPKILSNAGISLSNSLMSQVIFGLANMLFTLFAIWKVDSWGRRPLYLWGTAGAAITLIATGLCFHFGVTSSILLLVCVLAFLACFAFSIGPLKFVVASEIFPNAIRGRALAISIMTMWVADTIVGQLTPILLKDFGSAGTFWFFAFFCIVAFAVVYKMLPETKGQSLEHIENYWKAKGWDAATQQTNDQHMPIH